MASRTHWDAQANVSEVKVILAEFTAAGASAPSLPATPKSGNALTAIARNGVGDYTLTFRDKFPQFWGLAALATAIADEAIFGKVVADNLSSAGTLQLQFYNDADGLDADPTGLVKVPILVRNSKLGLNNV